MKSIGRVASLLGAMWVMISGDFPARANVYATNIKLDGSTNNVATVPAGLVQISYILNQPADAGVSVQISTGPSVVWSNFLAGGSPGTAVGTNSTVWGGTNQSGQNIGAGIYNVSITAASAGYSTWTNITDDSGNFDVPVPSGMAVNKNTNSPFYGRVFVSDAENGTPGLCKCNADGSPADEGGFSDGGYPWSAGYGIGGGSTYSPWKIAIGSDDAVYVNDWSGSGVVLGFDECISNYSFVLDADNYPNPMVLLSGPWVTGSGTNTQIWMADDHTNNSQSVGIVRWNLTNDTTVTNDTGATVVGISPSGLNLGPYDVSVDTNGNIYTIQSLDGVDDPSKASFPRVFRYPAYSGTPELTPSWSIGSPDNSLEYAYGIAVDPSARLVAVAVRGYGPSSGGFVGVNGAVNLYNASNGSLVTRLTTNDDFVSVAWDNVGNLYAGDFSTATWRAYSPPGPNQATTPAVPIIQVYDAITPPLLIEPTVLTNQFCFALSGQSNVTYVIQGSPDLVTWVPLTTNYATVALRTIALPASAGASFFQAVVP